MDAKNTLDTGAFTLAEAAKYCGVSYPVMLAWVNLPTFPAIRSGRRWVIPKSALTEWLDAQAKARMEI